MRTVLLPSLVFGAVVVGACTMACTVIEEPGSESHASGAQGQPHGGASAHAADARPLSHAEPSEEGRTRLLPLGYGNGAINVSTGLRTDPKGSEEGRGAVDRLSAGSTDAPSRAAFDPSVTGMWGDQGAGGPSGGTATLTDAPRTAPRR